MANNGASRKYMPMLVTKGTPTNGPSYCDIGNQLIRAAPGKYVRCNKQLLRSKLIHDIIENMHKQHANFTDDDKVRFAIDNAACDMECYNTNMQFDV